MHFTLYYLVIFIYIYTWHKVNNWKMSENLKYHFTPSYCRIVITPLLYECDTNPMLTLIRTLEYFMWFFFTEQILIIDNNLSNENCIFIIYEKLLRGQNTFFSNLKCIQVQKGNMENVTLDIHGTSHWVRLTFGCDT